MQKDNTDAGSKHDNNWIDILLDAAVPDGRHRIIYHVLAPYLINVKNLDIDKAMRIIEDWIERCDAYEPTSSSIKAFAEHTCQNAYKFGRRPKNLGYFRDKYKQLYRMIVNIAESYGLNIE